jgi:Tol biopolymer transport system component
MRRHCLVPGSLALASALALGCAPDAVSDGGAEVELLAVTSAALSQAEQVASVDVTISGSGIDPSMTAKLAKVSGKWQGIVGGIPAGEVRTFRGDARDAGGGTLYDGTADQRIVKGERAFVALVLQQKNKRAPFANAAPQIGSATASAASVEPGGTVVVSATASDADGDALAYAWSADAGSFASGTSATATWAAPTTEGTATLTLRVKDDKGATAAISFAVAVKAGTGRGSASVAASFNAAPAVEAITIDRTPLDVGQTAQLGVVASDADGDAIRSYAWSSTCTGRFSDAASAAPSFTLEALPTAGSSCAFVVKVTDARGGANTGELSIATGKEAPVDRAPVVDTTFQAADTAGGGERLVFRISGHDPDRTAVSYAWASSAGTLGTVTTTASGESEVVWTAPACLDRTALVSATLTDASGTSTTHAFSVAPAANAACGGSSMRVVSVTPTGGAADGDSHVSAVSSAISGDGRYIAFMSYATNLTAHQGYEGSGSNIFRRDTATATTELVSVSLEGTRADCYNESPSISASGRYVAFRSCASNLVSAARGDYVYVKDLETGSTTLASVDASGSPSIGMVHYPHISGDGRHVCFMAYSRLDPADTNDIWDIYVRDLDGGTTRLASSGRPDEASYGCSLSYDGRRVVFLTSGALVPEDTNRDFDVYVRDLESGALTLVSRYASGNAAGAVSWPTISADGRHVGFVTRASLDPADTNGWYGDDIYVRDLSTGAVKLATPPTEAVRFGSLHRPSLSADGAVVAFVGASFVDGTWSDQVFTRDLRTGSLTLVSRAPDGSRGDVYSSSASLSADGRFVTFSSAASNFPQPDTAGRHDVFVAAAR